MLALLIFFLLANSIFIKPSFNSIFDILLAIIFVFCVAIAASIIDLKENSLSD